MFLDFLRYISFLEERVSGVAERREVTRDNVLQFYKKK